VKEATHKRPHIIVILFYEMSIETESRLVVAIGFGKRDIKK
jgi:hypothetical protein